MDHRYALQMQLDEANRILSGLREELGDVRTAMLAAQRRAHSLTKLIEGYVELFPELAEPQEVADVDANDGDKPRGQEAVLAVMKESPGKWFTVPSMTRELAQRGWQPATDNPANATRAALDRLVSAPGQVRKDRGATGSVTYSYRPFEPPTTATGMTDHRRPERGGVAERPIAPA